MLQIPDAKLNISLIPHSLFILLCGRASGNRRQATGVGHQATGDRRRATGVRQLETGW